jgi:hypothetical protein
MNTQRTPLILTAFFAALVLGLFVTAARADGGYYYHNTGRHVGSRTTDITPFRGHPRVWAVEPYPGHPTVIVTRPHRGHRPVIVGTLDDDDGCDRRSYRRSYRRSSTWRYRDYNRRSHYRSYHRRWSRHGSSGGSVRFSFGW